MTIEIILAEGVALETLDDKREEAKVSFDKNIYSGKGTQCLTDILTHLSCNCGESDINSSYSCIFGCADPCKGRAPGDEDARP
jgi:hypothetical protein